MTADPPRANALPDLFAAALEIVWHSVSFSFTFNSASDVPVLPSADDGKGRRKLPFAPISRKQTRSSAKQVRTMRKIALLGGQGGRPKIGEENGRCGAIKPWITKRKA